jgi:gluconolactonase
MYYTDLNFAYLGYDNLPPIQLPAAVYRWDPQQKVVLPIISRNEINPNGVRVSPDMRTLYVTDSTGTFAGAGPYSPASGPGDTFWLGPYVYAYDLNEQMLPVNRRLFAQARQGIADGIHVDDAGNVWTGKHYIHFTFRRTLC